MSDPVVRVNAALEGPYAIEGELGEGGMAKVSVAFAALAAVATLVAGCSSPAPPALNTGPFPPMPSLKAFYGPLTLSLLFLALTAISARALITPESIVQASDTTEPGRLIRRINFVLSDRPLTENPDGWLEYDGSIYTPERGYGWLRDLASHGVDRGADAGIRMPDGTRETPESLGRLVLANWQGAHQENLPIVFRIDLPNGWYHVGCTSVDPGTSPLPLVDQRSFKCRSHDAILAGPRYGKPLVVSGDELIEGSGAVEVVNGQLRVVIGDPAYAGWTWSHPGPWYRGWGRWWGHDEQYAANLIQRLSRYVDPGFHSLRLNSLVIERIQPPPGVREINFRDLFSRDNHHDINFGLQPNERWTEISLQHPDSPRVRSDLYQTSLRLTGVPGTRTVSSLLQPMSSPAGGVVRYATSVSIYTGSGSERGAGYQEAGLLILADDGGVSEFSSTFIGVSVGGPLGGAVIYRLGDGAGGYANIVQIPASHLPFEIEEGEYEILVEHDIASGALTSIRVNGHEVADQIPSEHLFQRVRRGQFGVRAVIDGTGTPVTLRQFYWHYQVTKPSAH